MLDLSRVYQHIEAMVDQHKTNVNDSKQKLIKASQTLSALEGGLKDIVAKVKDSKTSWLVAEPVEDVTILHSLPDVPEDYTVLASDGSQLFPDHHEVSLCYLINIGTVFLRYGDDSTARLASVPRLYYRDEELYMDENGAKRLVDSQRVSSIRTLAEMKGLVDIGADCTSAIAIALTDGTLIQWAAEQQGEWADQFIKQLITYYESLKQQRIPMAGYISGTRSTDVVNMLRVHLCPYDRANCDECNQRGKPEANCELISGLRDATLFEKCLAPGQRTALFKSNSKVLKSYGNHRVYFFYINVESEIVRVEVPEWVALDGNYINRVHSIAVDQARKGGGYPVSLAEAHQQAVVDGNDRKLFYELVNKKLVEGGLTSEITYKSMRKRSVPV